MRDNRQFMQELRSRTFSQDELISLINSNWWGDLHCHFDPPDIDPANQSEWWQMWTLLPRYGCDRFVLRAGDVILQSLQQLNELDRNHPFWDTLSFWHVVTVTSTYCKWVLEQNPDDTLALWTSACLDVLRGANEFGQTYWIKLNAQGDFDISWAVQAALYAECSVGLIDQQLATFLKETQREKEAIPLLDFISQSPSSFIADFGKRVLALISN